MSDKPLKEIIAESVAAAGPERFREFFETINAATEPPSAVSALRDAVDASAPTSVSAAALFAAAAGDPMDEMRRIVAEMPSYTMPEMPPPPSLELSTEAYLSWERRRAGIPSDPAQAAAQLARLLTAVDPGQLATALRRIADALDALAPMKEGPANDD